MEVFYRNKIESLAKEWRDKSVNVYNEEIAVQRFIENKIVDRFILKTIKKGELLKEIPIDIEGRQYSVNIANQSINIRDDDNKYFWYMFRNKYGEYYFRKYEFYKNYSQQYKDFGLILDALDQYLDSKTPPEWNTVEKIEEAIRFVENFRKRCIDYQISDAKFFEFVFVGDNINGNKKKFISTSYDDFLKYMKLYKNILFSDNIHESYNFCDLNHGFKCVSNFLSNFEINKTLLSFELDKCFFTGSRYLEYIKVYKRNDDDGQHGYIMNVFKQINMDLYKKLYEKGITQKTKLQSKNISLQQYDYKLHDLFYNFSFLKFLLPEEININGSRILVQINLNKWDMSYYYYLNSFPSIGDFFDIYFIPHDKNYFLYMSLSNFLNNEYDKAELSKIYLSSVKKNKNLLNKLLQNKKNLIESIKEHKELIMKHILNEIEKHVKKVRENDMLLDTEEEGERLVIERILIENKINEIENKQTNNSLYDSFLADYTDKYLSN